jgi:Uma2 family endonuclease
VAESALLADLREKGPIYARARVPIYWIVNIKDLTIEVYTQPAAGKSPRYRHRQDYADGQTIPLILGGHEFAQIPVRDLLPFIATK